MKVDFRIKRSAPFRAACMTEEKPYSDRAIRSSFAKVAEWAARRKLKTGRWLFVEHWEEGGRVKWDACIEVKGRAKGSGGVAVKNLRAADVVSVTFNPDEVSPRIVYHAISDWVRWRRKDGTISRTGRFREVYPGDPWKEAAAWQNMEVQLMISRKK